MVFPKKFEYVPVQKNFPENFFLPGKNKGFTYLVYIAILYYMADYYDNYENCEKYLIERGYTRYKCNVLVIDVLFSVMYLKKYGENQESEQLPCQGMKLEGNGLSCIRRNDLDDMVAVLQFVPSIFSWMRVKSSKE